MKKVLSPIVIIALSLASIIATADSAMISCQSSWLYNIFNSCPNPQKPIYNVAPNVQCPGPSCVTQYSVCEHKSHGLDVSHSVFLRSEINSTNYVTEGYKGSQQKQACIEIKNSFNRGQAFLNTNERVLRVLLRPDKEEKQRRSGRWSYRYYCQLNIYYVPYMAKASKACPPIGYAPQAVITGYQEEPQASCGTDQHADMAPATTNYMELVSKGADPQSIRCLACENLNQDYPYTEIAECLSENLDGVDVATLSNTDKAALYKQAQSIDQQVRAVGKPLTMSQANLINYLLSLGAKVPLLNK